MLVVFFTSHSEHGLPDRHCSSDHTSSVRLAGQFRLLWSHSNSIIFWSFQLPLLNTCLTLDNWLRISSWSKRLRCYWLKHHWISNKDPSAAGCEKHHQAVTVLVLWCATSVLPKVMNRYGLDPSKHKHSKTQSCHTVVHSTSGGFRYLELLPLRVDTEGNMSSLACCNLCHGKRMYSIQ